MGLLDDAIREHLDLKRRRGADPAEVERAEHEALGPVRRGPEPMAAEEAEPLLPYDDQGSEPERVGAETAEPEWHEEPVGDEPLEAAPVDREPPPPQFTEFRAPAARPATDSASEPVPEDDPFAEDEPFVADEPAAHPPPAAAAPRPPAAEGEPPAPSRFSTARDETQEFSATDAEAAQRGEDVLEETPEFLQDTPDHDRLWFEQRPPRDFDFDG
jgi:hypothetical protein